MSIVLIFNSVLGIWDSTLCATFDAVPFLESRELGIIEHAMRVRIRLRTVSPPYGTQESLGQER